MAPRPPALSRGKGVSSGGGGDEEEKVQDRSRLECSHKRQCAKKRKRKEKAKLFEGTAVVSSGLVSQVHREEECVSL